MSTLAAQTSLCCARAQPTVGWQTGSSPVRAKVGDIGTNWLVIGEGEAVRQVLTKFVAAAAAASVVLGVATPALGATRRFTDPDDTAGNVDVTRVLVRNEAHVVVRARFQDIRRAESSFLLVYFDTDAGRSGPEFLARGTFGRAGEWQITRARRWHRVGAGIECRIDMEADYRANTVTYRVFRGCLDGHRGRVRVSVDAGNSGEVEMKSDRAPGYHQFFGWVARA
jgi:hypothetical protein